jgi:hypothetical protein
MLYPIYYIISDELLQHTIPANGNIISFQTELLVKDNLINAYHVAGKLSVSNQFCLYIIVSGEIDDAIATDIISLFFFPKYKKHKSKVPELLVFCKKREYLHHFEQVMTKNAKEQGFTEVKILYLNTGENNELPIYSAFDFEIIKTEYRKMLNDPASAESGLYVSIQQVNHISIINKLLEKEEKEFCQQDHALFTLKQRNKELNERLEQVELVCESAKQELINQASHINILRSSSQATHLQYYYNNEYEVLPLWYKRFGHLIKALMGKRTISSLFNEYKRKYKQ